MAFRPRNELENTRILRNWLILDTDCNPTRVVRVARSVMHFVVLELEIGQDERSKPVYDLLGLC